MYQEYDLVTLKTGISSAKLEAGAIGTVLLVYAGPPRAYEVEFRNNEMTFTLLEEQLAPVGQPVSPAVPA